MHRFVLIDGHAILHRAYHALPPLTTSDGRLVNAVFGFTSMLLRVISDLKPTHLAVAFDRPEPTFREKIYKDYQAQRPKMDDELAKQIDIVKKVLTQMGIPIYDAKGYEADDVIASLVRQASDKFESHLSAKAENSKFEIIIVTGDRDILQLIDSRTKVYMPVRGLSKSKMYGERQVEEKFGVKPSQIADYKALVGDQSDNYKGVAGVGPKTAYILLKKFKTLEGVYEHINKVESRKLRRNLEENTDSAIMAKKLAKIVQDVPVEIDLEKCRLRNLDRPDIYALFDELEFRSLIPRLSSRTKNFLDSARERKKSEIKREESKTEQIKLF